MRASFNDLSVLIVVEREDGPIGTDEAEAAYVAVVARIPTPRS